MLHEENAQNLIEAIARYTGEDVSCLQNSSVPLNNDILNIQQHLTTKHVLADGVSVQVGLIYTSLSGNLQKRDIIIRRVLKSKQDFFIDAFCLGIQAPRLIKIDSIREITDKKSGQKYTQPRIFFSNVLGVDFDEEKPQSYCCAKDVPVAPLSTTKGLGELKTAIQRTRNELTALVFVSGVDGHKDVSECQQIVQYVHKRCPDLSFPDESLCNYLNLIQPDLISFHQSMQRIVVQEGWVVKLFLEEMIHMITSDGHIDEKERLFLAEIMTILKQEGFVIKF